MRRYVFIFSLLFVLACRAPAAPDSGFLKHTELLEESPSIPFNSVWAAENFDPRQYDTIVVHPIDTTHLIQMSWWDRLSFANLSGSLNPQSEASNLARYFEQKVTEELKTRSARPHFAPKPTGKTLRLELAIIEVVPTKAWLNAIAYGIAGPLDHGAVAMEGRFRDLRSGEIVARWKDRQYGQTAFVSVADLFWYSHAVHTIEYWSKILTVIAGQPMSEKIEGRTALTYKVW